MLYNVKAGIIGLEKLGLEYAKLLKDHVKNLNLIAASGRTQKEILFAKNDLSLEYVYNDEKALFANHDIDAIFILSDTRFKADHAIQAIEAGKHVFMLNPIALNLEDAEQVRKTASSHPSQVVMCGSTIRINPVFNSLKETIDSGEYGPIKFIQIESSFVRSLQKTFTLPSGSKYLDCLLDEIDLALWLGKSEYESVNVIENGPYKICQVYDKTTLQYQFLMGLNSNNAYGSLKIFCVRARIEINNQIPHEYKVYPDTGEVLSKTAGQGTDFSFLDYMQLHHFTQCIMGNSRNRFTLDHAVESMRLALAFEKSDVLNKSVTL